MQPEERVPRKPNYGFDKRRKEQDRKAKKDAKRLERQQRREGQPDESGEPGVVDDQAAPREEDAAGGDRAP